MEFWIHRTSRYFLFRTWRGRGHSVQFLYTDMNGIQMKVMWFPWCDQSSEHCKLNVKEHEVDHFITSITRLSDLCTCVILCSSMDSSLHIHNAKVERGSRVFFWSNPISFSLHAHSWDFLQQLSVCLMRHHRWRPPFISCKLLKTFGSCLYQHS